MFPYPLVILGGFLSFPGYYSEMKILLEKASGRKAYIVPVTIYDWMWSISAFGWARILDKLKRSVETAIRESGSERVVIVGHSSGGVIARLFLSSSLFRGRIYAGVESVRMLVSLGSPHQNRRGSPMRRKVERRFPGAFFSPQVGYISVAGSAVFGRKKGSRMERSAYRSYAILGGKGQVWGDGIVPLSSALLEGACAVVLKDVFHHKRKNKRWYGSADVISQWWEELRNFLD